jgi:imidazolonepropionase-like amidohydrolase
MNAARKGRYPRLRLGVVGGLLVASLVFAGGEPQASSKPLALVGGHLLTQTDGGPLKATILIRDGKIAAVGQDVTIPGDAEKIDVSGFVVTPGLIDARSSLWLTTAATRESAADGGLDILDGVDPHEEDWKEVIRQGVTAVYVQPSERGILGGRGAVLRVGPASEVEELIVKAGAAAQAALGTAAAPRPAAVATLPRRFGGDPPVIEPAPPAPTPSTTANSLGRYAQYEQLKKLFEAVKKYDEEWQKHEEAEKTKKDKSAKDTQAPAAKERSSSAPKRDPTKDFLRKVLKGDVPLRIEVHREDDIQNALRLADEFHLRVVLDGVSNPRNAIESLVNRRIPLVLGPFVEMEEVPVYRKDRPTDWPKPLLAADARWALGTFSEQPRGSRLLRVQAAAAVATGIKAERVLKAITRDAAEILGVGDRLGTISPGKLADLAVFAGDPLDPSVPVRLVISGGRVVYKTSTPPALTQYPVPITRYSERDLPARLPKKYLFKCQRFLAEDGKFQPGIVLVENGKVAAIGGAPPVADGIPTYDLGSAVVTPGLVAAHSDFGLSGMIDDPAEADAGQVRAGDVYDPQHRPVRSLLEGGFTSALFAPGSVNVITGSCCGVRLGAAEPCLDNAGVKFVLTDSSRGASRPPLASLDELSSFALRGARGPTRYPGSLAGQVELIEQVLSAKGPGTELYLPSGVRRQIQSERRRQITALLGRKQVAFFEAHTRAEVDAALQLIARFKLRGVLVSPEEIKPFLSEIKGLGVGIVARLVQSGDYDRPLLELAEAAVADVPVAFGSGSAQELRITAALAVNAGMPREAAWRGLTTTAVQMTGLPENAGRLMVGAPADLVIWDGSPLDLRSRPLRVVVEGKVAW